MPKILVNMLFEKTNIYIYLKKARLLSKLLLSGWNKLKGMFS